jgi:hypothetical protein
MVVWSGALYIAKREREREKRERETTVQALVFGWRAINRFLSPTISST